MTIQHEIILWDDGEIRLRLLPVDPDQQYRFGDHLASGCITFGVSYEDARFKGYDCFTLFGREHAAFLKKLHEAQSTWEGSFRLTDAGCDTDGYVEFCVSRQGHITVSGQLGASISEFSLRFLLHGDQTMLSLMENCLSI